MTKSSLTSKGLQYNNNSSTWAQQRPNTKPCPTKLQHPRCHYDHQEFPHLLTSINWWSSQKKKGKTTHETQKQAERVT